MNRWYKIEWSDGLTWHLIEDNIIKIKDAQQHAKESAIDQPNTMIKISDNNEQPVTTYKYSYSVMYRWNGQGWGIDAQ